jgi:hypothetical protein
MEKKKKEKCILLATPHGFSFMKEKKKGKGIEREQTLSHSHSQKLFPFNLVVSWLLVGFSFEPPPPRNTAGIFFFLLLIFIRLHTLPFFFSPITFLFFCSLSIYYTFTSHTHTFLRVKKN